jgi:hypothetical protein
MKLGRKLSKISLSQKGGTTKPKDGMVWWCGGVVLLLEAVLPDVPALAVFVPPFGVL